MTVRNLVGSAALCLGGALLASNVANAQQERGYWNVADGDAAHSRWQKAETKISPESVGKEFKFLWKIKLGTRAASAPAFSAPLLMPGMISSRGFKDLVLWSDASSVYAVDSELGTLFWQKDFKLPSSGRGACGGANVQLLLEPPRIVRFGARRPAGAPAPPPEPPPGSPRRVGSVPGGGYFSLKGIYALTPDGFLHEQILATGLDFAPPVKFLPAPNGRSEGLNMAGLVMYATTAHDCPGTPNAVWAFDLNTSDNTLSSYKTGKVALASATGPTIGADGTVYAATAAGQSDTSGGIYANSIVALAAKDLKVKDWYTAPESAGKTVNATPIVLSYKDKDVVAAFDNSGRIVLLDPTSLGGSDHHTPMAQTKPVIADFTGKETEGLATWKSKDGTTWLAASIAGAVSAEVTFPSGNGGATHGSVVAFKIEEQGGQMVLTPAWMSEDIGKPAPPAVANGVVFALAGGDAGTPAKLYALDGASGKQLYSSADAISGYAVKAGLSVGDGHVFFTTNDNTLYSFGIGIEH